MKKTWFLVLTMIAALAIFPAYGWALNVSPADVSGGLGDEVVVSINISDVGGGLDIDAFGFTINFDQDVLTFVNADKAHADGLEHPLFGSMTAEEKGWAMYKHLVHHRKQFGLQGEVRNI